MLARITQLGARHPRRTTLARRLHQGDRHRHSRGGADMSDRDDLEPQVARSEQAQPIRAPTGIPPLVPALRALATQAHGGAK